MSLRRAIIDQLHAGPRHLVALSRALRLPHPMVAAELHDMEDDGTVIQHETGVYQLSAWTQRQEQERSRNEPDSR